MKAPRIVLLVAGALLLPPLAGCASRGSVQELRAQLAASRAEVEAFRKMQESSTRELAKTVGELKALESQVRALGQAERTAAERAARVESRLGDAEEAVKGLRASVDGVARELAQRSAPPARPQSEAADRERPARGGAAEQLYAAALASFRAGEHGQAVLEFTDFIARYPRHALAANAQFWIAEAFYIQHDYRQALEEFRKVVAMNGKGGKTPDALLKIGLALRALNETGQAREAWQQILQTYPGSEAARQARVLLRAHAVPVGRGR